MKNARNPFFVENVKSYHVGFVNKIEIMEGWYVA